MSPALNSTKNNICGGVVLYEIQGGNVGRPTHRNTSWDWARFETCAQKWVDLSEGDYGVSVLNDCKFGHDVRENVIRIRLLRGTTMPDPEADQGEQHFAYSLLPHAGRWGEKTVAAAYALNDPLLVAAGPGGAGKAGASLIRLDRPNIVVETVKRAEDGNGVIVRFYESQRQRGAVTLTAGLELAEVWRTNLLEEIRGLRRIQEALDIETIPGGSSAQTLPPAEAPIAPEPVAPPPVEEVTLKAPAVKHAEPEPVAPQAAPVDSQAAVPTLPAQAPAKEAPAPVVPSLPAEQAVPASAVPVQSSAQADVPQPVSGGEAEIAALSRPRPRWAWLSPARGPLC